MEFIEQVVSGFVTMYNLIGFTVHVENIILT